MHPSPSSDTPCPSCEGQGKGCDECYGEGTYAAYATEQMARLLPLLRERGLLHGKWIIRRREDIG